MKTHSARFVYATEIVPAAWGVWFWKSLADQVSCGMGADLSLVKAGHFAEMCQTILRNAEFCGRITAKKVAAFNQEVNALGEAYIDLEN